MTTNIKQPELGYYIVGDKTFTSKIEAYIYGTQTNQEVVWDFNKSVFDSYNWASEPNESLEELYNQRAKELREKYDYIILLYSGGSDSNNIFESFVRQNLHIDELLVLQNEKAVKNFKTIDFNDKSAVNGQYSEYILQTIPRLQEIASLYPNIKITVKDMTDHIFSNFKTHSDGGWIEHKMEWLNPVHLRWDIPSLNEYKPLLDSDTKSAFIWGIDKPRCAFYPGSNNFYIAFTDGTVSGGPIGFLRNYTNTKIELFYWSPDALKILCKQAHIVKRYIETRKDLQPYWSWPVSLDTVRTIHEPILRNLIYSNWKEGIWFQADKSLGVWAQQYDQWFFTRHTELEFYQDVWRDGINHVVKYAKNFITYRNNMPDGLQPCMQYHKVDKFNTQNA